MEKNTILIDGDKLSVNANGFELSVDCRHDDLAPKGAKERIVSMYAAALDARNGAAALDARPVPALQNIGIFCIVKFRGAKFF